MLSRSLPSCFFAGAAAFAITLGAGHAWAEAQQEHFEAGKPKRAGTAKSIAPARLAPLGATVESVLAAGRQLTRPTQPLGAQSDRHHIAIAAVR